MKNLTKLEDYKEFIQDIKLSIKSSQIKAALLVNQELLHLYWFLGERIVTKEKEATWGDGFLSQMSKDLQLEFPEIKGFSLRNLKYIRQWFRFWSNSSEFGQQLVAQIPWGHNIVIIGKIKNSKEALFYVQKTIENNWSRNVLVHYILTNLYERDGKSLTNFNATLPKPDSDLARQILKDPYNFDFLNLHAEHNERELEQALTENITRFLLELGAGFSYIGRQYPIDFEGQEFFIDLLFYHFKLRCFFVIELKKGDFKPEYVGKLNFYCNVIDGVIKQENDKPTIGLILCQNKNELVAEYTLKGIDKPIGISQYQLTKHLPENLKYSLPSIEEIEAELGGLLEDIKDFGSEE